MENLEKNLISGRITELLSARNCNIKDLADDLGIAYKTVYNYAKGKSEATAGFFIALNARLGINLDWFFTGEGEMYRANRPDQLLIDDRSHVRYGKGSAVVNQSGINNGNIVTAVGHNELNMGGRAERICTFVRDYMQSHDGEDQVWLEKQLERAVPEYKEWKDRG